MLTKYVRALVPKVWLLVVGLAFAALDAVVHIGYFGRRAVPWLIGAVVIAQFLVWREAQGRVDILERTAGAIVNAGGGEPGWDPHCGLTADAKDIVFGLSSA